MSREVSRLIFPKKVLVTGATGLLGSSLVPYLKELGYQTTCIGKSNSSDLNTDLTSFQQATRVLDDSKPDVIINLAALTNVDRCEIYPQEAYMLNVKIVENLCSWIKTQVQDCHLIQVSTDQIYDGLGPHAEGEITICNLYALSKLSGEFVARTVPSTILRTNFAGRSFCKQRTSLTDWLNGALIDKIEINVFDDVMFSPLAITTLCYCIERCIVERPTGIFNLGSREGMSKADFAFAFAAARGLDTTNLKRVDSASKSRLVARRPTDMRMNSRLFATSMDMDLPLLADEVCRMADEYV